MGAPTNHLAMAKESPYTEPSKKVDAKPYDPKAKPGYKVDGDPRQIKNWGRPQSSY
jgi:hypothetical protein